MFKKMGILLGAFVLYLTITIWLDQDTLWVNPVEDEIVVFADLDNKYGLLNSETGEILIEPKYESLRCFSNFDTCVTYLNNKSGLIDYEGNELISRLYDWISIYITHDVESNILLAKKQKEISFFNHQGQLINKSNDFTTVLVNHIIVNSNLILDINGNVVFNDLPSGFVITKFDEENKIVYVRDDIKKYFISLVDPNLTMIEIDYRDYRPFSEGLMAVQSDEENDFKWGYIDMSGQLVIDYLFSISVGDFKDGVAFGWKEINDESTYTIIAINKSGEELNTIRNSSELINYKEDITHHFGMSFDTFYVNNQDGTVYFRYEDDGFGFKVQYAEDSNNRRIMSKLFDEDSEVVIDHPFDDIKYFNNNFFCIEVNDQWTCYNKLGEKQLDMTFSEVYDEDLPYINLYSEVKKTQYLFDSNLNLIYQTKRNEKFKFTPSQEYILVFDENTIYNYNLLNGEKEAIYEVTLYDQVLQKLTMSFFIFFSNFAIIVLLYNIDIRKNKRVKDNSYNN